MRHQHHCSQCVSTLLQQFYRGVTDQSITFGLGLRHIRVSHLVLGSHTLESHALIFKIAFLKSTIIFGPL